MGRGQAAGSSGGDRARKRSPLPEPRPEATAEPAGSVAAPRSARLTPFGAGPPLSTSAVARQGDVLCGGGDVHPLARRRPGGSLPRAHSLGLEGLDLVGLDLGATALRLVDIDGGKTQTRTDLVGRQLHLGTVLAFVGLPAALLQPTGDDDPHALGEAEGHVLGKVPPADDVEERGALLPLLGGPVLPAPVHCDAELGRGLTFPGVADLWRAPRGAM
jgi:hypothetical protein